MCDHIVIEATPSPNKDLDIVLWRFTCLTCPVEARYVEHTDLPKAV